MFQWVASGPAGIFKSSFLHSRERTAKWGYPEEMAWEARKLITPIVSCREEITQFWENRPCLFYHSEGFKIMICFLQGLLFTKFREKKDIDSKLRGIYSICFRGSRGLNILIVHRAECLLA